MNLPTFIDAAELYGILIDKSQVPNKDYLVIDVRDTDFAGGNIIGCKNIPSTKFSYEIEAVHQEIQHIPKLIFHCALSQVRGPKSANKYVNFLNDNNLSKEVFILRDGFEGFKSLYGNDKLVVEKVSYGY